MPINLAKETEKVHVVLDKIEAVTKVEIKANVVVMEDMSGSMSWNVHNGIVDDIIGKMLAIGLNVDVDGSIDVFSFNDTAKEIGKVTKKNVDGFVKDVFLSKTRASGGTTYSSAIEKVVGKYGRPNQAKGLFAKVFGSKDVVDKTIPTLVFFITDGDNERGDYNRAKKLLADCSDLPIFWQFIGIGNGRRESFPFLNELDTMSGRVVDNANFFPANSTMSNDDLYEQILIEFPSWLKEVKSKGILL
jgi:hypothetical protein